MYSALWEKCARLATKYTASSSQICFGNEGDVSDSMDGVIRAAMRAIISSRSRHMFHIVRHSHPRVLTIFVNGNGGRRKSRVGESADRNGDTVFGVLADVV